MNYKFDPELWMETAAPKFKKNYIHQYVKLKVDSPNMTNSYNQIPSPIKAEAILKIVGRDKYGKAVNCSYPVPRKFFNSDKDRVLRVYWRCPTCDHVKEEGLPESWIDEGKIVFVVFKTNDKLKDVA